MEPGEHIVWSGNGSGWNLSLGPLKYVAISLLVATVAGWAFFVNGSSAGSALLGLLLVSVALLGAAPQVTQVFRPKNERYVLTNRRVMISHSGSVLANHLSYYPVRDLADWRMSGGIKRVKVSTWRRSVIFESLVLASPTLSNTIEAAFTGIDDPERIGRLAAETLKLPLIGAPT